MQSEEEQAQRFSLQYFFPPSAVGETGRIGGLGNRREIGHGRLAERSLAPALPSKVGALSKVFAQETFHPSVHGDARWDIMHMPVVHDVVVSIGSCTLLHMPPSRIS